jgi:hypothetical protein
LSEHADSWQKSGVNHRLMMLAAVLLTLAGCGDDQKPPPALSGKLHDGRIQGVQWRTPTHSGTTGADGTFTYLAGETVTFSIGDVELGAAPGSPNITLFTLAGLTPPTSERTLRRQLDRAVRLSTPLTRAINLDLLLIALDADGDPANGIDVRNRAGALHGTSLDFDQRLAAFGTELYSTVPSLNQSIPLVKPIAHLYASLGLRVPVHAQTRVMSENSGRLSVGVKTFTYLPDGRLHAEDDDGDGDGLADSHVGYEYDAFGRSTRVDLLQDYDLDHVVDQKFSSTTEFDAHGKILGNVQDQENAGFGPRQIWTLVEYAVDDFGRPLRQVVDLDVGGDGTVDSRQVAIVELDASGLHGVFTSTTDEGADGVPDSILRTTEDDDSQRRVLSRVVEWDDGADGTVDSRDTETYVYDDVARTMRAVRESDVDANGTADWRNVATWQLDRAGNVIAQSSSIEPFADGTIWQTQSFTREFDAERRVTKAIRDDDFSGDGIADSRQLDTMTYDVLGNPTLITSDLDADVDGNLDAHFDEGSEYGADGELLGSAAHYDFNGDGVTDIRAGTTVENAVVDDGVLILTNWIFRSRYSGQ